ncbi:unnamed protein product [Dracunculus medinensis]|uniref:MIF4G_like_2 domain-containing protein n=1 Tax=Dracunculus medinensis TaxID=318479 RepID=A0A0N4UEV6_DRAME|nr:unnamed protein product [Dracunculus medinensis]
MSFPNAYISNKELMVLDKIRSSLAQWIPMHICQFIMAARIPVFPDYDHVTLIREILLIVEAPHRIHPYPDHLRIKLKHAH